MKTPHLLKAFFSCIIIFFTSFHTISAQRTRIGVTAGFGKYDLSNYKSNLNDPYVFVHLESEDSEYTGYSYELTGIKCTEKFRNTPSVSFMADREINNNQFLGAIFSYRTTGSRRHLKDYSGEYKYDMILQSFRIGPHYKSKVHSDSALIMYLGIGAGIIKTKLSTEEKFTIYDEVKFSENKEYEHQTIYIEPMLHINIPLFQSISIEGGIGYEFNINPVNTNNFNRPYNKAEFVNWKGIRGTLSLVQTF